MLTVRLKDSRAKLLVDTSGEALRALAGSSIPVDVLRMDSHEAQELAGRPLPLRSDSADFAAGLVRDGVARSVIVARGADGSVIAGADGAWHAAAARVKVVSAVGAWLTALSRASCWPWRATGRWKRRWHLARQQHRPP